MANTNETATHNTPSGVGGDKYEAVIGLEIHAQLQTESKLFCGDSAAFGGAPNTHISAITMGHPGTLPKTNKKAVEYAIKMGLACNCEIVKDNYFARKNYFYPDLPKGYQTSQHTTPICKGGIVRFTYTKEDDNGDKTEMSAAIQLNRIHLEEDAGKSIHDFDDDYTCVDLNRAGVPLIEIVTEPCIGNSDEAAAYFSEIKRLLEWDGICDGNMEEGSLRCDANVSIRLKGDKELGTKVEVKNLNSIRNVKVAIDYEIARMIAIVEDGGKIVQQTRSFNADNDTTFSMRDKEEANDYRYFACPDLSPFHLTDERIEEVKDSMKKKRVDFIRDFVALGLPKLIAEQICETFEDANEFENIIPTLTNKESVITAGNLYVNRIKKTYPDKEMKPAYIKRERIAETVPGLTDMVWNNFIGASGGTQSIMSYIVGEKGPETDVYVIAKKLNLLQVSDTNELEGWVDEAISKMPDKVAEYKKGKKGLIGLFVGEVKKLSKGKADPKVVTELLQKKLG